MQVQKVRELLSTADSLKRSMLLATLLIKDNCAREDPLWCKWGGSLEPIDSQASVFDDFVAEGEQGPPPTIGLLRISDKVEANGSTLHEGQTVWFSASKHSLNAILNDIDQYKNHFLHPQDLHFCYPPDSPTAMYGGPGDWETWPSTIRQTVLSNMPILYT